MAGVSPISAQTSSSTFYGISKQISYVQTSAAVPVLATSETGRFEWLGEQPGTLRLPTGTTQMVTASAGLDPCFASIAALDAAFPAGTDTLTVGNVSGINLTMPANPYSSDIPRVLNGTWNAAGPTLATAFSIGVFHRRFPSAGRWRIRVSNFSTTISE